MVSALENFRLNDDQVADLRTAIDENNYFEAQNIMNVALVARDTSLTGADISQMLNDPNSSLSKSLNGLNDDKLVGELQDRYNGMGTETAFSLIDGEQYEAAEELAANNFAGQLKETFGESATIVQPPDYGLDRNGQKYISTIIALPITREEINQITRNELLNIREDVGLTKSDISFGNAFEVGHPDNTISITMPGNPEDLSKNYDTLSTFAERTDEIQTVVGTNPKTATPIKDIERPANLNDMLNVKPRPVQEEAAPDQPSNPPSPEELDINHQDTQDLRKQLLDGWTPPGEQSSRSSSPADMQAALDKVGGISSEGITYAPESREIASVEDKQAILAELIQKDPIPVEETGANDVQLASNTTAKDHTGKSGGATLA